MQHVEIIQLSQDDCKDDLRDCKDDLRDFASLKMFKSVMADH